MLVDARRRRSRRRTAGSRGASAKSPRRWSSGTISRSWRSMSHASGCSSIVARRNSIPYFSANPSNWPCPNIGRPGQRRQQRRHAEVLVALAELLDRRLLVGVVHEVDVALEDLGVELEGLLEHPPVARVVLVAEHVHERASCRRGACPGSGRSSPRAARTPRRAAACRAPRRRPGRRPRARTRSGIAASNSACDIVPNSARDGIAPPPSPGPGNHSRRTCFFASTIAASKRMTGNRRATSTIVRMTCSRTAAWREVELGGVVPREARAVVAVVDVAPLARSSGRAARTRPRRRCCPSSGPRAGPRRARPRRGSRRRTCSRGRAARAARGTTRGARSPSASRCPCGWAPCPRPAARRAPRPAAGGSPRRPRRRGRRRSGSRRASRPTRPRPGCRARLLIRSRRAAALPQPDQPQAR